MMHHVRKDLAGVLMVATKLRTTVVMREGYHLLNRRIPCEFLFKLLLDILDNTVHTSHSRDDPEFIADACTTVRAEVTIEGCFMLGRLNLSKIRLICVFQKAFKISL